MKLGISRELEAHLLICFFLPQHHLRIHSVVFFRKARDLIELSI
jgi:hypothetical protein